MARKPKWPADSVTRRKVADLVPSARNARTHSEAQIAQLVASIREWGWTMPILIDEAGGIIAGHGRVLAAESMGLKDVPTMTATGWSDTQKRAYAIADNQLALNAGWDTDILAGEIADLKLDDFDLPLMGFGEAETLNLLTPAYDVSDPLAEWAGMPEYRNEDKTAFRSILIHFKDQDAVDEFARLTEAQLTDKTKSTWFPHLPYHVVSDRSYEDAS